MDELTNGLRKVTPSGRPYPWEREGSLKETFVRFEQLAYLTGTTGGIDDGRERFSQGRLLRPGSGRKMTRQQFSHIRKCLQAPQSCLDPNSAKNWPRDKKKVIPQWVKNQNKGRSPSDKVAWPTYGKDVLNAKGKKIAAKGEPYDGHHYIPKAVGGPNAAWNIVPVPKPLHQSVIHR